MRIVSLGHAAFAVVLIAIGVAGLINGNFAAIWQGPPEGFPYRDVLPYACGAIAVACGAGLLFTATQALAARVLLLAFLIWMIAFKVPFIFRAPLEEGSYQTNGENAVLVAAAWVLYAWFSGAWEKRHLALVTGDNGVRIARLFFAFAMIAFGFSHFAYLNLTAPLVPSWMMWPTGWAYFTGGAYLAAGIGILFGVFGRLAATLATVQIALITTLVWIPVLIAGDVTPFHWQEITFSCALTAGAGVVADSYREAPWFGVFKF